MILLQSAWPEKTFFLNAIFKLRAEQTGATKRITDGGLKPKVDGQFF